MLVDAVKAVGWIVLPQHNIGRGTQLVGFGLPARAILVAPCRGIQPRQPLQGRVGDGLVVDRHSPLVARPQVRGIRTRLPFDVAPIGGVRTFDQLRIGVAALTEHPLHGGVQAFDQRQAAQGLLEPCRVGHGIEGFGGVDDSACFFVRDHRGFVDLEVRTDGGGD